MRSMLRFGLACILIVSGCGDPSGSTNQPPVDQPAKEKVASGGDSTPQERRSREQMALNFEGLLRDSMNLGANDFARAARWYPYRIGKVAILRLTLLPPGGARRNFIELDESHFSLPPAIQAVRGSEVETLVFLSRTVTVGPPPSFEIQVHSEDWYLWDLTNQVIIRWEDIGEDPIKAILALPDTPPSPRGPPQKPLESRSSGAKVIIVPDTDESDEEEAPPEGTD
ncbi:MAG: hypothetical protein QF752_14150 [Planctomycetota bacterium]|nr:hypothetical protein [Planctomycetota bacterium]